MHNIDSREAWLRGESKTPSNGVRWLLVESVARRLSGRAVAHAVRVATDMSWDLGLDSEYALVVARDGMTEANAEAFHGQWLDCFYDALRAEEPSGIEIERLGEAKARARTEERVAQPVVPTLPEPDKALTKDERSHVTALVMYFDDEAGESLAHSKAEAMLIARALRLLLSGEPSLPHVEALPEVDKVAP